MTIRLELPRLLFGPGERQWLSDELAALGVVRPLIVSDPGIVRAGLVDLVQSVLLEPAAVFANTPENPAADDLEAAAAVYRQHACDGLIGLGGGAALDTAKMVSVLAQSPELDASALIGHPETIQRRAPLLVLPTTVGTGSEASPVAALHLDRAQPAVGTRGRLLVPDVVICDPDLAHSLPPHLVAATAVDALSHCVEGFFAEPAHPFVDALALDGAARVFANLEPALTANGQEARAELMAAAFAGGIAINKGLGPAHAVALSCGDQPVHHGALIAVALPHTVAILERHMPGKAARLSSAIGLPPKTGLGDAIGRLAAKAGMPNSLRAAGYRIGDARALAHRMAGSHFNRTSPYAPDAAEYLALIEAIG